MSEFRQKILQQLDRIDKLPTLPEVVSRLLEVLENPKSSANDIARILSDDPAIMSRVLKVSNSSFYRRGLSSEIESIDIATVRLGYKTISDIAISTSIFSVFPKEKEQKSLNRHEFWKHCIYVGMIAKSILKMSTLKKWDFNLDKVTLAGLLHDIGIIVMEEYFNDFFVQIINYANEKKLPLLAVERAVLGIHHSEIGAWLAKKWNLDQDFITCIEYYHTPSKASAKDQQLLKLLSAAKFICLENKLGNFGINTPFIVEENIWKELGITQEEIPNILELAEKESAISELLNLV